MSRAKRWTPAKPHRVRCATCREPADQYHGEQDVYLVERRILAILARSPMTPAALEAELLRLWGHDSVAIMGSAINNMQHDERVSYTFWCWPPNLKAEWTWYRTDQPFIMTGESYLYNQDCWKRLREEHEAQVDAQRRPRVKRKKPAEARCR